MQVSMRSAEETPREAPSRVKLHNYTKSCRVAERINFICLYKVLICIFHQQLFTSADGITETTTPTFRRDGRHGKKWTGIHFGNH